MGGAVEELADAVGKAVLPVEAVRVAYVFGSRARGDNRADSDLDVALVYERSRDWEGRERVRRDGLRALTRSDAERIAAAATAGRRYDDDGPKRALFQRAAARVAASWAADGRS
jgi:predicted nucleotidyltransferase